MRAINLPENALVAVPEEVELEAAAAILLKAMTVNYLFNDTFPLSGEQVLFHAAAGSRADCLPVGKALRGST